MKALNNLIIVILAIVMINLSACSPVLYSTVGQNVPLLRQKGEVTFSAGFATAGNDGYGVPGFDAQFAVAVDSSLAIFSSLYHLSEAGYGSGSYLELGIGTFKHNPTSNLTGEIFIGSGYGHIKNIMEGQPIKSDFLKVFIQPSGGFSTQVIDIAFTPRIGGVFFISNTDGGDPEINQFLSEKKASFVFEPGVTVRLGFKNVKLQYQYNYSTLAYSNANADADPVYNNFMSFNLFFLISDRWNKAKK